MNLSRPHQILVSHLRQRQRLLAMLDAEVHDGIKAQDFEVSDKPAPMDPPPRPDPTGETAINGDRARQLRSELDHAETQLIAAAGRLYGQSAHGSLREATALVGLWVKHRSRPSAPDAVRRIDSACQTIHRISVEVLEVRPPDAAQRAKLGAVDPPETWCVFCHNEPPCTAKPTTVKGNLPSGRWVGRSCYDYIRTRGKVPSRRDLEALARTGRWPNQKEKAA